MASTVPVTAQLVGHAFVSQYYNVLHQLPHMVYRFYTDASRLTRAEAGPDGAVLCARSQVEIHNTVMSMGYEECKAEIVTVDSSESIGGSVLVLVTGVMHLHRSNGRRNFVQTFLLAPQERGYYVLNDILRYLDDETQPLVQVHKMANGSLDMFDRLQVSSAEADGKARRFAPHMVSKEAVEPEVQFQEYAELPLSNVPKATQAGVEDRVSHQQSEVLQSEWDLPNEQLSLPEESRHFEDESADKKSYASILRFPRDSSAVATQPATSTVNHHHQANEQNNYSYQHSSAGLLANPSSSSLDDSTIESAEVKSVYIKNLPSNVTELQLEEDLIKAGCSRPISVILKSYKDGGVYAFVDFDDSASAINAIEASPISVGGRRAHIEERKSTYTGGPTRGRGGRARGTLPSTGARGRGPSSNPGSSVRGGAGYVDGDVSSRGRGTRSSRAGYGGSSARV